MKRLRVVVISTAALATILSFQNCGKAEFGQAPSPTSASADQTSSGSEGSQSIGTSQGGSTTVTNSGSSTASSSTPVTGGGLPGTVASATPPATTLPPTNPPVTTPPASTPAAPAKLPASASGNTVTTSSGQVIYFVNNTGVSLGTATIIAQSEYSTTVGLYNSLSGRQNRVFVNVDPISGRAVSVTAASRSDFMCHDPNADPCGPNYTNLQSGAQEANCASPILFSGALNGVVGGYQNNAGAWVIDNCH